MAGWTPALREVGAAGFQFLLEFRHEGLERFFYGNFHLFEFDSSARSGRTTAEEGDPCLPRGLIVFDLNVLRAVRQNKQLD
jgi:hypothetical protein